MKKLSMFLMAAVLVGLSLPLYAQGHSGARSNLGAERRHGQDRANEVHALNAEKKKDKKSKKTHRFAFHHNDKDKGKGKSDNKRH